MYVKEISDHFLGNIERMGYECIPYELEGPHCCINTKLKKFTWNPKTMTLFDVVHDWRHAVNGDTCRCGHDDTTNPFEARANKEAILILWGLFLNHGGNFETFSKFIDATSCPFYYAKSVIVNDYSDIWGDHARLA